MKTTFGCMILALSQLSCRTSNKDQSAALRDIAAEHNTDNDLGCVCQKDATENLYSLMKYTASSDSVTAQHLDTNKVSLRDCVQSKFKFCKSTF